MPPSPGGANSVESDERGRVQGNDSTGAGHPYHETLPIPSCLESGCPVLRLPSEAVVSELWILPTASRKQDKELSDEFTEPDWGRLNAILAENARWANLSVTIEEITKENESLIRDLSRYDPTVAVPLLASLLTIPKYQSHCIRFEILVALAVVQVKPQMWCKHE